MIALFVLFTFSAQDHIMMARAAVAECGWTKRDCHAGVWHTMRNRARRRNQTMARVVYDYCATWDPRVDTPRSRWVKELPDVVDRVTTSSGDRDRGGSLLRDNRRVGSGSSGDRLGRLPVGAPASWPSNVSWAAHAPRWIAIVRRTSQFLRGRVRNPCARNPYHTGNTSSIDLARATRAGWAQLECGDTGHQRFYTDLLK